MVEVHEAQIVHSEPADLSLEEALDGPFSHNWKAAMKDEIDALKENQS